MPTSRADIARGSRSTTTASVDKSTQQRVIRIKLPSISYFCCITWFVTAIVFIGLFSARTTSNNSDNDCAAEIATWQHEYVRADELEDLDSKYVLYFDGAQYHPNPNHPADGDTCMEGTHRTLSGISVTNRRMLSKRMLAPPSRVAQNIDKSNCSCTNGVIKPDLCKSTYRCDPVNQVATIQSLTCTCKQLGKCTEEYSYEGCAQYTCSADTESTCFPTTCNVCGYADQQSRPCLSGCYHTNTAYSDSKFQCNCGGQYIQLVS